MESGMQENGNYASRLSAWLRVAAIGRNPKRTLMRVVALVIAVFLLRQFVLLPIKVEGPSMFPTYQTNGVNFVNRLVYYFHPPRRGDVVAIRTSGESIMYMKRIVGLPGETVGFHNGFVVVNGHQLDEPYVRFRSDWEAPPETMGPDEYYFVGDNRSMSPDEHYHGRAHRNRIVGKILLCKNLFTSSWWRP
jgi:signal peptidase I